MSREKQIEEMAKAMCGNGMPDGNCATDDEPCYLECVYGSCADRLYAKGYRKQEWISVDERLPETTLQKIYITSQDISSGDVVEEEEKMVQKSELVAVLSKRYLGGTVDLYPDLDYFIDGCWVYNNCVTHWMPLPEAPKMKGGAE